MNVILKIKYTEEIRNSIEWMKVSRKSYREQNKHTNKKRTALLKENKEKIQIISSGSLTLETRNSRKRQKGRLRKNTRKFPKMRRHRHHNSKFPLRAQFSKSQRITPQHITEFQKNEEEILKSSGDTSCLQRIGYLTHI